MFIFHSNFSVFYFLSFECDKILSLHFTQMILIEDRQCPVISLPEHNAGVREV